MNTAKSSGRNGPIMGLALGGGGARGFAHIGILQVLQEAGITAGAVAGTSIGALIGAGYAAGSLERLAEAARSIRLRDIPKLLSPSWSLSGVFSGSNAIEWLSSLIEVERIEALSMPYAAIATDINTGARVVIKRGTLSTAVRASISIPGIFTPIPRGRRMLVDGGIVDPLPVDAARGLGAGFVIAVDLFSDDATVDPLPLEKPNSALEPTLGYLRRLLPAESQPRTRRKRHIPNALEVIERTLVISQHELTQARLKSHPPDFLLNPPVGEIGVLDFHRGEEGIELGRESARKHLPELRAALEEHERRHHGWRRWLCGRDSQYGS